MKCYNVFAWNTRNAWNTLSKRVRDMWSAFTLHLRYRYATGTVWLEFFSGRAQILYEDLPPLEFIGWPSGPLTPNARRAYDVMHCRPRENPCSVQPSRTRGIKLRAWTFLDERSSTGTLMLSLRTINLRVILVMSVIALNGNVSIDLSLNASTNKI